MGWGATGTGKLVLRSIFATQQFTLQVPKEAGRVIYLGILLTPTAAVRGEYRARMQVPVHVSREIHSLAFC